MYTINKSFLHEDHNMSGYDLILKIRDLENRLDQLGFVMTKSKYTYYDNKDVVAVKPKDQNSLPIYSRDAEVFVGSFDELKFWIKGIEWSRKYDAQVFGEDHDKKRAQREQLINNKKLVSILKGDDKNE